MQLMELRRKSPSCFGKLQSAKHACAKELLGMKRGQARQLLRCLGSAMQCAKGAYQTLQGRAGSLCGPELQAKRILHTTTKDF